jgi:hypothetical protein
LLSLPGGLLGLRARLPARTICLAGSGEIAYAVAIFVHELASTTTIGVGSARTIALGRTCALSIPHARRVGLAGSGEIAYAVAIFVHELASTTTIGVGSAWTIALGRTSGCTCALSIPHARRVGLTGSDEVTNAVAVFVYEFASAATVSVGSTRTIALGCTYALGIPHARRVGLPATCKVTNTVAVLVYELTRAATIGVGAAGALTTWTTGAIALSSRYANTQQQRGQHHQSDYSKTPCHLHHFQSPN